MTPDDDDAPQTVFLQVQMSVLVEHVEHATNMKCSTTSEVSLSKAKHNVHNDQNHDNISICTITLSFCSRLAAVDRGMQTNDDGRQ